jgi:hypothetical protein
MDTAAKTPPIGRPSKAARKGRRYQIGVIVTGETKAVIAQSAKDSGRTISRQVEHLVERCLHYDQVLKDMRTTVEAIDKGSVEAALRRANWKCDQNGRWSPPEVHGLPPSRFITEEEAQ